MTRVAFILSTFLILIAAAVIAADGQSTTKKPPAKAPATKTAPAPARPAAPASKPSAPKAEAAVPFKVGETLTFDVSWSNTVSAGTAVLRVLEKKPSFNSVAYYIVGEAQPGSLLSRLYTLYYKADTLIDAYTLLPQRGSLYSREGRRQRTKITEFKHAAKSARFIMQTSTTMTKDLTVPTDAQDMLSAIYALRATGATTGDRVSMAVSDSGRMYNVEFVMGARETVKRGSNAVPALRVTPVIVDEKGVAVAKGTTLWLSDDASRVPVRLETQLAVGRFVLALQ